MGHEYVTQEAISDLFVGNGASYLNVENHKDGMYHNSTQYFCCTEEQI
jgi:hypothetical protein